MTLAQKLLDQSAWTDRQRIEIAMETITSKPPGDQTRQRLLKALEQFRTVYRSDTDAAARMIAENETVPAEHARTAAETVELASMTMLVHSLLNLDATKTRE